MKRASYPHPGTGTAARIRVWVTGNVIRVGLGTGSQNGVPAQPSYVHDQLLFLKVQVLTVSIQEKTARLSAPVPQINSIVYSIDTEMVTGTNLLLTAYVYSN